MHYCTLLFTKELPKEYEIYEKIKEFDENIDGVYESNPTFTFDWYQIVGRYSALLELKFDTDSDNEYKWRFYEKDPRNNRLFISTALKTLEKGERNSFCFREEEYFALMGSRHGYILVDSAKIKDILNIDDVRGYNSVFSDGRSTTRSHWNGEEWIDNEDYDKEVSEYIKEHPDYFVTVLDIHS